MLGTPCNCLSPCPADVQSGLGWTKPVGHDGTGTCDDLYRSIELLMANNYATSTFFDDAVVLGVSVMAANPGLVSYWNTLSVTYDGTTLDWKFTGEL